MSVAERVHELDVLRGMALYGVFLMNMLGFAGDALHMLAVPVLAAGYVCAVVVGMNAPATQRWPAQCAHAGRMALTNYVAQADLRPVVSTSRRACSGT